MKQSSKADWDRAFSAATARTRTYNRRECFVCGRSIGEGAYSGSDGNFRKHMATHNKEQGK